MNSDTIYNDRMAVDASSSVRRRPMDTVKRRLRRMVQSMVAHYWERQAVRELSGLSSHTLRDIGIRPEDIRSVAADLAKERARQWARQAGASNGFGG